MGGKPPLPLILEAWYDTPDEAKIQCLTEHLRWAEKHDCLDAIESYLRNLREEDWYHLAHTGDSVAKHLPTGLNGASDSNNLSEEQLKALDDIDRKYGFAPGQLDALNERYDFQGNGLTWRLVHEALLLALSADTTSAPPTQLVRSFVRQLEQAIAESVEPKENPDEAAVVINATGMMWSYVHSRLLTALMSPDATGEPARIVRSFTDLLAKELVGWRVLRPEELRQLQESWDLYRPKVLRQAMRSRVASGLTWLFVQAALEAAIERSSEDIPFVLVRPFVDEVRRALKREGVLTANGEIPPGEPKEYPLSLFYCCLSSAIVWLIKIDASRYISSELPCAGAGSL